MLVLRLLFDCLLRHWFHSIFDLLPPARLPCAGREHSIRSLRKSQALLLRSAAGNASTTLVGFILPLRISSCVLMK
jgi:hypothetical protein